MQCYSDVFSALRNTESSMAGNKGRPLQTHFFNLFFSDKLMGEAFLTPEQEVHYRSGIIFLCDDI